MADRDMDRHGNDRDRTRDERDLRRDERDLGRRDDRPYGQYEDRTGMGLEAERFRRGMTGRGDQHDDGGRESMQSGGSLQDADRGGYRDRDRPGYGRGWEGGQQDYGRDSSGWGERGAGQYGAQGAYGQAYGPQGGMGADRGYGSGTLQGRGGEMSRPLGGAYGQGGGQQSGPHAGRGPRGYQRDPQRLVEEVNDRLTNDPHVDATDIEVHCENGEITLRGFVENRMQKRRAEDLAEQVSGVRDVHNQVRVRQEPIQRGQEGGSQQAGSGGGTRNEPDARKA